MIKSIAVSYAQKTSGFWDILWHVTDSHRVFEAEQWLKWKNVPS